MKGRILAVMALLTMGFMVGCDITITQVETKYGYFTFTNGVVGTIMLQAYAGTAPSSWITGNMVSTPLAFGEGDVAKVEVGTWDSIMIFSNATYPGMVYNVTYSKSTLIAVNTPTYDWFYTNMDMSFTVEENVTNTNDNTVPSGYLGISNTTEHSIYSIKLVSGTSYNFVTNMDSVNGKILADTFGNTNNITDGAGVGATPFQLAMGTYYITIENWTGTNVDRVSTFPVSIINPGVTNWIIFKGIWSNI